MQQSAKYYTNNSSHNIYMLYRVQHNGTHINQKKTNSYR